MIIITKKKKSSSYYGFFVKAVNTDYYYSSHVCVVRASVVLARPRVYETHRADVCERRPVIVVTTDLITADAALPELRTPWAVSIIFITVIMLLLFFFRIIIIAFRIWRRGRSPPTVHTYT